MGSSITGVLTPVFKTLFLGGNFAGFETSELSRYPEPRMYVRRASLLPSIFLLNVILFSRMRLYCIQGTDWPSGVAFRVGEGSNPGCKPLRFHVCPSPQTLRTKEEMEIWNGMIWNLESLAFFLMISHKECTYNVQSNYV